MENPSSTSTTIKYDRVIGVVPGREASDVISFRLTIAEGIIDVGFNAGEGDVVVYVTFMGVPAGQGPTIPHPNGESPCPL